MNVMKFRKLLAVLIFVLFPAIFGYSFAVPAAATAPDTPEMETVVNVVSGVRITWNPVQNVGRYEVYRSKGASDSFQYLAKTTACTFLDTDVVSGTKYSYRIRAFYRTDGSGYSAVKATIFVNTPDFSSRANSAYGVDLTWKPVNGATGYAIYRKNEEADAVWARIATIGSPDVTVFRDSDVRDSHGTIFHYCIRALAGPQKNILSGCLGKGRTVYRMKSPSLKDVTIKTNKNVVVSWNPYTGADGYQIRFLNDSFCYLLPYSNPVVTSMEAVISESGTYKVQIRAYHTVNGAGTYYSAWTPATEINYTR